ncbi:MAG: TldD/PmbA family protein [Acidobacteriota bacterium]|nr:TldD/PmbA family protein [Acidobacteriota bacterium]
MTPEPTFAPAPEVVERALAASRGDGCVVIVRESSNVNARFAVNTATSNGRSRSREVTVVSLVNGARGVATASAQRSGEVDVVDLVAASEALARSAPPAPDAAALVTGGADADFAVEAPATTRDELVAVVGGLTRAFPDAERRGVTLAGFATHTVTTTYLGSSAGPRRRFVQRTGEFQLNGRADGGRRSSWSSAAGPTLTALDVDAHVGDVHKRLEWARATRDVGAGRYETVLPPVAVADLMIYLYWTMSARDARDGRTVFSAPGGTTRVGERLSDLGFTLSSDPAAPGMECEPFVAVSASSNVASAFDNAAPLGPVKWIDAGVLARLFTPRADAERERTEFAAPIDNLALELPGSSGTTEDLVSRTERGLLVTSLWYMREVDPASLLLTGLTRDGVYLIEDGAVVGAVNNFRFNESPVDVLARSLETGATERTVGREFGQYFNRVAMPALRVAEFNMSSVSPAS